MLKNEFVEETEKIRKAHGITTRKFANLIGISPSMYCDIKFGRKELTNDIKHSIENVLKNYIEEGK